MEISPVLLAAAMLLALIAVRLSELVLLYRTRQLVLTYLRTRDLLEVALERGAHSLAARHQAELSEIERLLPVEVASVLSEQTHGLLR